MSTPKISLSLMVTNAEELATMLALLRRTEQQDNDAIKHARAERDEAMANATGWQRAAEMRSEDYVTLAQHAESLASQLEAAQHQWEELTDLLQQTRNERDELSELLAAANEKLDGGKNQPVTHPGAGHITERHRLLGRMADDLHPDEDPRDHDAPTFKVCPHGRRPDETCIFCERPREAFAPTH
jgi:hypothetical protein